MHMIKVQFPDLHEQFKNTRALTIMASKIGEVLEIEAVDSYIKRPAGPMTTIKLKDISIYPDKFKFRPWQKDQSPATLWRKEFCTPSYQTSAESAGGSTIMHEHA